MVLNGPGLEKRQALLFRCVDIGAELFAMIATCARARRDTRANPADRSPLELADVFCRHSRRKIERLFAELRSNDDLATYRLARGVLDHRFAWLERGIIEAPGAPAEVAAHDLAAVASGR